ncbi:anti-sigma B factor RsbW [Paenibacillus sp. FSL H8-0537]|uniref:anti-sigma B factor RsbW n=1 Tax=Paenibacillus sp. FSL H8-0537 TaxID=2921399 RepID=UPI00310150FB
MADMKTSVQLTIPAEADYLDIVRLTLYGLAVKLGFEYEQIEDMKVAVGEACNNAIIHGYEQLGSGELQVNFEQQLDGLKICIRDNGTSFNYEQAVNRTAGALHTTRLSDAPIGGLGLYMMQALMDHVEVNTTSGTEVILTKLLGRKEEMA